MCTWCGSKVTSTCVVRYKFKLILLKIFIKWNLNLVAFHFFTKRPRFIVYILPYSLPKVVITSCQYENTKQTNDVYISNVSKLFDNVNICIALHQSLRPIFEKKNFFKISTMGCALAFWQKKYSYWYKNGCLVLFFILFKLLLSSTLSFYQNIISHSHRLKISSKNDGGSFSHKT